MIDSKKKIRNYFVDEAGDTTLYNKKGKVILGNEGVSKCFMVGVAEIKNHNLAKQMLKELREELLADTYFKGVPSMQPERGKTAKYFHAKDDLPEIRMEVFKVLKKLDIKVQMVIRRKEVIAESAKLIFKATGKKINGNDIYDDLVKRLFRNLLHKSDENKIHFARRGKTERTQALQTAIAKAKHNFDIRYSKKSNKPVDIIPAYPYEFIGLQIIDYYLWAIQRLYERKEERFFNYLSDDFRLIMDLDDKRNKPYGEWYSDSNKLSLKKLKPV